MRTNKYVVFNNQTKTCQFLKTNEIVLDNNVLIACTFEYGNIIAQLDISYFKWVKNHCKKSVIEFKRKVLESLTIDVKADILNTDKSIYKRLLYSYDIELI
jgi:hypothetical protein